MAFFYEYEITIGGELYPYYLSNSTVEIVDKLLAIDASSFLLVYDNNVDVKIVKTMEELISKKTPCNMLGIDTHETLKNITTLSNTIDKAIGGKITRQSCIVAIGGGVLGNIVGLAACLIFRGIRLVHCPTTVIAAADSVLSLKQAINSSYGKNMMGAFYKPVAIYTDFNFFHTLPNRHVQAGQVELVKNLLTIIPDDRELFSQLHNTDSELSFNTLKLIIELSIKAKCKVLKNDRHERLDGLVLEYGHTTGHAIELLSNGKINHGEGVGFGMLVAGEISHDLGYISDEELNTHYSLLEKLNIKQYLVQVQQYTSEEILKVMEYDNKRGYITTTNSTIPMVLLEGLGTCKKTSGINIVNVEKDVVIKNINKVMNYIK